MENIVRGIHFNGMSFADLVVQLVIHDTVDV